MLQNWFWILQNCSALSERSWDEKQKNQKNQRSAGQSIIMWKSRLKHICKLAKVSLVIVILNKSCKVPHLWSSRASWYVMVLMKGADCGILWETVQSPLWMGNMKTSCTVSGHVLSQRVSHVVTGFVKEWVYTCVENGQTTPRQTLTSSCYASE